MDFNLKSMFCREEDHTIDILMTGLAGVGVGVGLMYLLDPSMGRRRRSMIMEGASSAASRAGEGLSSAWEKTSESAGGAWESVSKGAHGAWESVSDGARGAMDKATSMFSGGQGQDQGGGRNAMQGRSGVPEIGEDAWSPTTRMLVGTAGGALVAFGMTQRFPLACALGTVGLGMVARAVTNFEVERYLGLGIHEPIDVHKSVVINGPVERVFPFFARYDTFPRFMSHIREVKSLESGRSHWVADGPVGMSVQWNAIETRREPNRLIAWRSEPGSIIANAGTLRFTPMGDGTRVDVHLWYVPPAGTLGHYTAKLFGTDPNKMMDEDLGRMRALIEEGATSTPAGGTVTRQEVTGGAPVPTV